MIVQFLALPYAVLRLAATAFVLIVRIGRQKF